MNYFIIFIVIIVIISLIMTKKRSNNNNEYNIPQSNDTHTQSNDTYIQSNNTHNNLPNDYYDFEDKYLEKIDNQLTAYSSYCNDTSVFFENHFNINQRIKKLQTCINKMDKIKDYYCNLGINGQKLFKQEADDYFQLWSKSDIIINKNGDDYCFEFDKMSFENYNFLTYLLELYVNDTEEQKKHLKQEAKYYEIFEAGGTEKYEEETGETEKIEYQKSIKNTLTEKLKSSDNIIQSKLINEFVDDDKYYVRKILKEMEANNEITKEKKGSSYIITYIKK